ncbi:MAG: hypothetical protein IJW50_00995 [Clostridia bacterium]|nr:hypothetical protein [Clostridia bacterium]
MRNKTVAVLGGDVRMYYAAQELQRLGYGILTWGVLKVGEQSCKKIEEAVQNANVLLLPLPFSKDGVHLNTDEAQIRLDYLLHLAKGKQILGGRLSEVFLRQAEREGCFCVDYFDSEVLQYKNALPTVEGAIEIAMRELPVVLDGTECAVIGYGRIGELLTQKLLALGAHVCVYARRETARLRAELLHCETADLAKHEGAISFAKDVRVIFNTVPERIIKRESLRQLSTECLIIDLASAPGGVDVAAAKELGVPLIWATALPGKCAPESAGIIVGQTVQAILENG